MSNGIQLPLFGFDSTVVPDIDFCQKDASVIESDVISNYEKFFNSIAKTNKTLGRADPVRLFLLTEIFQLVVQRSITDSTGKQNLLKYSRGDALDNVGAKWGLRGGRLKAQKAKVTLRFSLSSVLAIVAVIPLHTLVSSNAGQQFQTTEEAIIPIGQLTVDVPAEAVEAGVLSNGLVAGQINQLIAWNAPYLVSVTNTDTSSGGTDKEEDDHLRARIWMAPESFSVAGPKEAYEYWAASANPNIMDVSVWSDAAHAGQVYVYPLMLNGTLPSQEVIDQIYAICNADNIRPLTDQLFVQAPTTVDYIPTVKFWIKTSDGQFAEDIRTKVVTAWDDYKTWQRSKIGRDINPSKCDQMMVAAGAKRTDIPGSLTFIFEVVGPQFVAFEDTTATCDYQGLEDE